MGHLIWLFVTYYKYNIENNKYYFGRTGGQVDSTDADSALRLVEKRDKYHHRNEDGFDKAKIDIFSTEKDAIRGREQMQIDKHKENDSSGNIYNGISPRNPKKNKYMAAALRVFGDALITFLIFRILF